MFRSRVKPVVIPQAEHLRIAGVLATLWGNRAFEPPPVERASLIAGIGLHDRGYGALDNSAIGEMADGEWEEIARRSFYQEYQDPVADLIAKYHVRRLASQGLTPERRRMAAEFTRLIEEKLISCGFPSELFERIDRITHLCDLVAFDYCFGEPTSGSVPVFPGNDETHPVTVSYRIEGERIAFTPWPLSTEHHLSYIIGYHRDGYPERLDPVILPFELVRT